MSTAPSYDLTLIQELVGCGAYIVTNSARLGARDVGCDEAEITDCVMTLSSTDFHKTMPAQSRPGFMQDVYRPTYKGQSLYVKLQIESSVDGHQAVVISFKTL